jgi:hypothetical protein
MVLLVEQTRVLASESSLIDNDTDYTRTTASWGTLHDYGNIGLFAELNLVPFCIVISVGGSQRYARLKIGSYYVWGKNDVSAGTYTGIACVPSGTYDVLLEGRDDSGGGLTVDRFQIGKAVLLDSTGKGLAAYASTITLRIPARNALPVGVLKSAVFMVRCWAYTSGGQTNFENAGDSLTNGVDLAVDGSQVNWTERNQDAGSIENASATYYGSLSVADSHTFAITKDNAATVVHISIYASPWLLAAADNEPVTLDFAQNSTLYVTLEPLDGNPTKHVKIGKKRAVSYGDTMDYYNTDPSTTAIIKFSYTFQTEKANATGLIVSGLGGCISQIGVDAA